MHATFNGSCIHLGELRERGVPLEDVADWFGHSNVSIAKQFYAEVTPIIMARTAEQIAAIFGE